jgi:hypothetical protein
MWLLPVLLTVTQAPTLVSGTEITRSRTISRGDYSIPSGGEKAALVIRGNNITVDCNQAIFRGTSATTEPDQRTGVGIEVVGNNVTLKNAIVRGYKVGIIARNAPGLRLINCDVSYNWKPRLLSTPEKEDESDWMSYHQNEKDEWLRYGAGIYLRGVAGFEVKGCRANGGGCGLMLTRCEKGLVWNNDFSYLSAIGVGMYRSSDNRIMHNRIDYCLRGFSYGVYNRGQDSAGILIYEQSNRNTFAYNSVTHGGDGFFLWAGQSTMDSGKGGCNDNLVYANDFSHAPTNGIEATFSRNRFINNLVLECWHGVWGGYSYDTKIIGNVFGYNTEGIAIEHGQKNEIAGNIFYRDDTAIHLWANAGAPDPNWGYPKTRDTKSHGYQIADNQFFGSATVALNITRTADVWLDTNRFDGANRVLKLGDDVTGITGIMNSVAFVGSPDDIRDGRAASKAGLSSDEMATLSASLNPVENLVPHASISALSSPKTSTDDAEYFGRFKQRAVAWNPWETPAILRKKGTESDLRQASLIQLDDKDWVAPLKGGMNPFLPTSAKRGWRTMFVDEWGPVGTQSPKIVRLQDVTRSGLDSMDGVQYQRFTVQGPTGKFRIVSTTGLRIVDLPAGQSGSVPGQFTAVGSRNQAGRVEVQLEFTGTRTTDYRGITAPAGKPVAFGWSEFRSPITWDVSFYKWDETLNASDPQRHPTDPFRDAPVKRMEVAALDFASSGAFFDGGPTNHFATLAEGSVTLPDGKFELNITSDDGIRFYVDGLKVLDEWHYQGPTSYKIPIGPGTHKLRVEHFEIDGYAALKVSVKQK